MTDKISVFYNKKLAQSEQILPFEEIIGLMAHVKAIGYNPFYSMKAWNLRYDVKKDAKTAGRVVSKNVLLPFDDSRFVLFADGTLFYRFDAPRQAIERVLKLAAEKKVMIKKVYGMHNVRQGYSYVNMRQLVENIDNIYSDEKNLYFEKLAPQKEFIKNLFANGNVCLTASKEEKINSECREYLALMSDGRFLVAEEYADRYGIRDYRKVETFCRNHPEYVYLQREYVPQGYIKAIYKKSEEFEWFISAIDAEESQGQEERVLTDKEKLEMNIFIHKLLADENKCLSVICPSEHFFYSPDTAKYALFTDGRLILDDSQLKIAENDLLAEMRKYFPDLNLQVERVPSYYLPEIYKRLLKVQKGAKEIYLEILKQKAKKLKNMLNIPHHEALEISAKMVGWTDWKEVNSIDESQARLAVHSEKFNKKTAEMFGYNQTEHEYKKYMEKHQK